MITTVERIRATGRQESPLSRGDERLQTRGQVPHELAGTLLQASPHPGLGTRLHADSVPLAVTGIRFRDGQARWYRADPDRRPPCPFAPMAALGEPVRLAGVPGSSTGARVTTAWPVRDPKEPYWHTVVTFADRRYAEHLVVRDDGSVVRSERIELDHAPLMHTVAVTEEHVVVLDLPVTYREAAALVGARSPYAWQAGRTARIGLLPRTGGGDATPRWFEIDPGYTFRVVNAHDDHTDGGDRVVIDALWHAGAPDRALPAPGPAPVVRWTLDLRTGAARSRELTGGLRVAVTDPAVAGRRHRFVFGTAGNTITRHDLETGHTAVHHLGAGRQAGQPVLVPSASGGAHAEGAGYLVAFVEDAARRSTTAVVLDAGDLAARPVAEVALPAPVPASPRATWLSAR
jgi:carotenoid cleavage dioxygenase